MLRWAPTDTTICTRTLAEALSTGCVRADKAGMRQTSDESETYETKEQVVTPHPMTSMRPPLAAPLDHDDRGPKLLPLMVTKVPPEYGTAAGLTLLTVGARTFLTGR